MTLQFPELARLPLERYASILSPGRLDEVLARIADVRARMAGRVVWNVSSTAIGGGVAEMVRSLLAYARGAGIDARWAVMGAPPEFFHVTKRLHNAIHGSAGDGTPLGPDERRLFEEVGRAAADELAPMLRPRDVVILHDPQPAAMLERLAAAGAVVVWRCHIGDDKPEPESERGWAFLAPYLQDAAAYVFSRAAYVPGVLDAARAVVIPPTIDPFSAKNGAIPEAAVRAILAESRIISGPTAGAVYTREDGTPGRVDRAASVLRDGPLPGPDVPLVVQVSRWDSLKDPVGVLEGFARADVRAGLVLAGPEVLAVTDDPEGAEVHGQVVAAWRALPARARARIQIVSVPSNDVEENAAVINALQRHAAIVVQKSLREGFGLTVTEAMWKGRPVVASAVGGIQDQIDDGVQGILLPDPTDLDALAAALRRLLGDPAAARRMGQAGRTRVLDRYLGIESLLRYGDLIERLDASADRRGS